MPNIRRHQSTSNETFEHQPELRLLPMLETLPNGHLTVLAVDERFEPHVLEGEFVVIDLADRRPEGGELFLLACNNARLMHELSFGLCHLSRRNGRWFANYGKGGLSEGPFREEYLSERLIGRVVGVFVPQPGAADTSGGENAS